MGFVEHTFVGVSDHRDCYVGGGGGEQDLFDCLVFSAVSAFDGGRCSEEVLDVFRTDVDITRRSLVNFFL